MVKQNFKTAIYRMLRNVLSVLIVQKNNTNNNKNLKQ